MSTCRELIEKILQLPWHYDGNCLSCYIGDNQSLAAYDIINDDHFLDPAFKKAFNAYLIEKGLGEYLHGPFDDDDLFSGSDEGDKTHYYIEIVGLTPSQQQALVDTLKLSCAPANFSSPEE